ncbi:MAG: cobalamin-dependent protein, partial [archaeon]|nr:cobalamin-dependent protein [archaeon]MCP8321459.1 cobalamin-dependent protein [archaeon]
MSVDVVLINPRDPSIDRVPFHTIVHSSLDIPPLGLLYIATVLNEAGFRVKIFDLNILSSNTPLNDFLKQVEALNPLMIGISSSTPTIHRALDIAKRLRKRMGRKVMIVVGGVHATFRSEEVLHKSYVDLVVRGEGENALLELARTIASGEKSLSQINGISYKRDGQIKHNDPKFLVIKDLDSLPYPDRGLIDIDAYQNPGIMISSRGCPARCIFCAAGAFGGHVYRARSAKNVIGEISLLVERWNFKNIFLVDNTMTIDVKRALELCSLIKESNLDMTWQCETRINVVNEDLIKAMADAGCTNIQFGIESGDEKILKEIKKGIKLRAVERTVECCVRHGIKPVCSFIIGHPSDTIETVGLTIEFGKKLMRMGAEVFFGLLTPFPGTEIFERRSYYGIRIVDRDYSKWDLAHAIIETNHLSQLDLLSLLVETQQEICS